jgi:hypothetical protein
MNSRAWSRAVVDCVRQNSLSSLPASSNEMTENAVLSMRNASSGVRIFFWPEMDGSSSGMGNPFGSEVAVDIVDHSKGRGFEERAMDLSRSFYVRAPSINAVRRALHRAPGGVRVVGRHDRETILCTHTMDDHSLSRHWPVIISRLAKAGLAVVSRPQRDPATTAQPADGDNP